MLNPFPQLLSLTFVAPTLLRIAVAVLFAYVAYRQWQRREELGRTTWPIIGSGVWTAWAFIAINTVLAILLLIGLYTQIAAILGMLTALKLFVWQHRFPRDMVLPRTTSALVFMICLSLLLTGAGAYALDIPL